MAATQRLAALLTAGSIAFSSTPAFAMNLGLGMGANAKAHGQTYAPFTSVGTNASAHANVNASVKPGRFMSALRHEFKAELRKEKDDTKKNVAITQEMIAKLQTRVEKSISNMINMFAGLAKRACASKTDEAATAACMTEIRTSLSTHVQAMITAAFGI